MYIYFIKMVDIFNLTFKQIWQKTVGIYYKNTVSIFNFNY